MTNYTEIGLAALKLEDRVEIAAEATLLEKNRGE
jgi:hypothetical protein